MNTLPCFVSHDLLGFGCFSLIESFAGKRVPSPALFSLIENCTRIVERFKRTFNPMAVQLRSSAGIDVTDG